MFQILRFEISQVLRFGIFMIWCFEIKFSIQAFSHVKFMLNSIISQVLTFQFYKISVLFYFSNFDFPIMQF